MRGFQAATFTLSDKTERILKNFSTSYSMPSCIVLRSKIILMAAEEKNNTQIAKAIGTSYSTVSIWRNRFYNSIDLIAQTEEYDGPDCEKKLSDVIKSVLSDKQRPGKEPVFTPEQIMLINELACKNPKDFGYELSCWKRMRIFKNYIRRKRI